MANPSLKNGYMSIANELVEELARKNIPGGEMRIIWVVWRKTWGWKQGDRKKDWDWVSLSQFEMATGMKRSNVCREIKSLIAKRILIKGKDGYKFNQNYHEWGVSKRIVVAKRIITSSQKDTRTSSQKDTHKRNLKETYTKDTESDFPEAEIIIHGEPEIHESPPVSLDLSLLAETFQPVNRRWRKMLDDHEQVAAGNDCLKSHGLTHLLGVAKALEKTNEIRYMPVITNLIELRDKLTKWELQLKKLAKESEKNQVLI